MRFLDFKIWDDNKKIMFYPVGVDILSISNLLKDICKDLRDESKISFLKYSGAKDRNGCKIYEKDIIRVPAFRKRKGQMDVYSKYLNKNHGFYYLNGVVNYREIYSENRKKSCLWNRDGWKIEPVDPIALKKLEEPIGKERDNQYVDFSYDFYKIEYFNRYLEKKESKKICDDNYISSIEIVGSVFETPELLENYNEDFKNLKPIPFSPIKKRFEILDFS